MLKAKLFKYIYLGNIFSLSGLNVIDIIDLIPCNKWLDTSFGETYDTHLGASLVV